MKIPRLALVLLALGLPVAAGHADELKIPIGTQDGAQAGALPPHGMLMTRVRAGWGEPQVALDPVGRPPITRWDYPRFSVYFEYDHVVHTVVRHQRTDSVTVQEQAQEE